MRIAKLFPYSSDVVSKKVDDQSHKWIDQNALEMSEEWIKHEYQNGWTLS